MCRRAITCCLIVLFGLAGLNVARAQAAPATQPAAMVKLKVERLVVFKNGYGLVAAGGTAVTDADGRAFITDVPDAAVLGCFWATSNDSILAMRAEWNEETTEQQQQTACLTMVELLRANVGKTLSLELNHKRTDGTPIVVEGKLLELLDVPPAKEQPWVRRDVAGGFALRAAPAVYSSFVQNGVAQGGSFTPTSFAGEGTLLRDIVPRGGEFIVVAQENDQRLILPVAQVHAVRGGADLVTTIARKQELFTRGKRLSFDFGKASAGKDVSLRLFYFTPGLRWIPTYRVSGELKDKAELALQGEIVNNVVDVEHAALDLVVGVPHFRFETTVSPLTLEEAMRSALAVTVLGNNGNILNSQFDNRSRMSQDRPILDGGMTAAPELSGAGGEQDLFVYNIPDFSLKKGARATVPLWQQQADLRHIYTFNLDTRRSRASGALIEQTIEQPSDGSKLDPRRSPNRIVLNQVWHQLELVNGGKAPWTTGAALMLRNMLPLGQDLLVYTPPTGKALLPVTVAVDLRGNIDEQETARTPNAMRFDGSEYMQVTKKGTITISSYRGEESQMRIMLGTAGKVAAASDDGKIKLNDARPGDWEDSHNVRVNNHSDVTWELTLEPGQTKHITYEVSFFTR